LHPVTLEEEVSVNIKVAAVIAADFNAELFLNFLLVQILTDPSKSGIAKIAVVLAFATDVVNVLKGIVSKMLISITKELTCPVLWYGPMKALLQ